jgi:hypothetical protein
VSVRSAHRAGVVLADAVIGNTRALNQASPVKLQDFYEEVGLEMTYEAEERAVDVTIRPARRVSTGVRGGTCTLTTRLTLPT